MDYLSDTKKDAGKDLEKSPGAGAANTEKVDTSTHDLDGNVSHIDYMNAETETRTVGAERVELNTLALAAAGKTDGVRDIGDDERAFNATRIDTAVRQNAAWLETQPVEVRMAAMVSPVIYAPVQE